MICGKPRISDGGPCRSFVLPGRDHCKWHGPKCHGKTHQGLSCGSLAIESKNWLYCKHHDHDQRTATKLFRQDNLCNDKSSVVVKFRGNKDAYTLTELPSKQGLSLSSCGLFRDNKDANTLAELPCIQGLSLSSFGMELDHTLEIHIARDAFDVATKQYSDRTRQQKAVKTSLQDKVQEAINITRNLNFTTREINLLKFQACEDFQEDYRNRTNDSGSGGCRGIVSEVLFLDQGLFPYLDHATNDVSSGQKKLTRKISGRIQKEMRKSSDAVLDCMEHEIGLEGEWAEALQRNLTAMRLD